MDGSKIDASEKGVYFKAFVVEKLWFFPYSLSVCVCQIKFMKSNSQIYRLSDLSTQWTEKKNTKMFAAINKYFMFALSVFIIVI